MSVCAPSTSARCTPLNFANAASSEPSAVLGEVELVHGARKVEVTVGVEDVGEPLALVFQVRLDLELRAEIAGLPRGFRHAPTAEALVPFLVRTVGDGAELACHAHALPRTAAGLVVATAPGWVVAHDFALQRTQRDRERVGRRGAGIDMMLRATPGNCAANARTVMPPIEGPATQATLSMPSSRSTSKPPRATSSSATSGNAMPNGRPVRGSIEAGLDEP